MIVFKSIIMFGNMMPLLTSIYSVMFMIINMIIISNSCAASMPNCPEKLTASQLRQLDQTGQISYNNNTYILDGSSRTIIHQATLVLEEKKSYQQNNHGKASCWYPTNSGYIGIRKK